MRFHGCSQGQGTDAEVALPGSGWGLGALLHHGPSPLGDTWALGTRQQASRTLNSGTRNPMGVTRCEEEHRGGAEINRNPTREGGRKQRERAARTPAPQRRRHRHAVPQHLTTTQPSTPVLLSHTHPSSSNSSSPSAHVRSAADRGRNCCSVAGGRHGDHRRDRCSPQRCAGRQRR